MDEAKRVPSAARSLQKETAKPNKGGACEKEIPVFPGDSRHV